MERCLHERATRSENTIAFHGKRLINAGLGCVKVGYRVERALIVWY